MFKFGVFNAIQSTCFETVSANYYYPCLADFQVIAHAYSAKYGKNFLVMVNLMQYPPQIISCQFCFSLIYPPSFIVFSPNWKWKNNSVRVGSHSDA